MTIHLAGEQRKREAAEFQQAGETLWKERLVVDDTRFHVELERAATSRQKATQLDKLQPLLADKPQKKGIQGKHRVTDTPLSVL